MTAPGQQAALRTIPSVERVLRNLRAQDVPLPLLTRIVRDALAALRQQLLTSAATLEAPEVIARIQATVDAVSRSRLRPVINATGVVVHTNLGRSPLAPLAADLLGRVAGGYTNLELDLQTGARGRRGGYVDLALATACGAEDALVVNNCAAALVLLLRHHSTAWRPEVIISRGELVQIGGGFRVPEILDAAGATLREVGTTNRTTVEDYDRVVGERTAMILKVHRSNFYMSGFVESPTTRGLADLARRHGVALVEDLGSGALWPTESAAGVEHEAMPGDVLEAGADLVTFSGDKLLGGPQAGVIAGSAKRVGALRRHPLFRALRCDKLVLAALEATLDLHLHQREGEVPIIGMLRCGTEELARRAGRLIKLAAAQGVIVRMVQSTAQVGGGSLPRSVLPSIALEVEASGESAESLARLLREGDPPVIGYIHAGQLRLDLRSVLPHEDPLLAAALAACAKPSSSGGGGKQ